MKQLAWFVASTLALTTGLLACSSDTTPGSFTPDPNAAGGDGQGGDGQGGDNQGGTSAQGGSTTGGTGGTSAGSGGSSNPFGGPGPGGGAGTSAGGSKGGNSNGGTSNGGAAQGCGNLGAPAACDSCISTNCCTQGSACGDTPACEGFLKCASTAKCTTQACLDDCGTKNPGGEDPALALNSCLVASCKTECSGSGSGGATQGCGVMFNMPTCDTCLSAHCCAEGSACGSEPQCMTFNQCAAACKDQTCVDACGMTSPKGAMAFGNLSQCLSASCKTECGF